MRGNVLNVVLYRVQDQGRNVIHFCEIISTEKTTESFAFCVVIFTCREDKYSIIRK